MTSCGDKFTDPCGHLLSVQYYQVCFMYCVLCIDVLYSMGQWAWKKIILSYLILYVLIT